jgi:hypothetical protein
MAERDLLWMSAVVFIPSVFALLLIFVPRGKEEIMRWLSLAGTGLTLGVSIGMFIAFYSDVIDSNNVRGGDQVPIGWRAIPGLINSTSITTWAPTALVCRWFC